MKLKGNSSSANGALIQEGLMFFFVEVIELLGQVSLKRKVEYVLDYNVTINIVVYTDANSTYPKPVDENYDYWFPLIKFFLTKSDTIEIHCWNEEIDTINEIQSLFNDNMEIVKEENLTIFKLIKSTITIDYLLNNSVNINGELKWFTVNLEKLMKPVFHSGHWGTELFIPNVTKEDIVFIKSIIPRHAILHEF